MNKIAVIQNQMILERLFATTIIAAAFMVASVVFANSPFDIEFPVAELGGCADKTACKAYCDEEKNAEACYSFAEKHGLGASREEVEESLKELEEDGGPGGCAEDEKNPTLACKRYCDSPANIGECVAYAKDHQLLEGEELEEAIKVAEALKRGVKLPAQCKNAESCRSTCDNPANLETARACFDFAAEADLLPPEVDREDAEKFFKAFAAGKTPFNSFAEMRQCDNPPSDEVMDKCVSFALEAGLIPEEEVEMIKKTGGRGPGGCRGKEQCEAYCEDNGEACFAFAEEHGILREEDKERMREGMEQMQEAIEDAPPEVLECVRGAIPEFDSILAGKKFPSPALGEKMRSCFDSFFRDSGGEFGGEGFPSGGFGDGNEDGEFGGPMREMNIPPEVKQCLADKFGEEFLNDLGKERPTSDTESRMRECFQDAFKNNGADDKEGGFSKDDFEGDRENFGKEQPCPAMPTVAFCGSDEDVMEREVPGCGMYRNCVPKRGGQNSRSDDSKSGEFFGEEYQQRFREEMGRQVEDEVKRQYDGEYQRQYEEQYNKIRAGFPEAEPVERSENVGQEQFMTAPQGRSAEAFPVNEPSFDGSAPPAYNPPLGEPSPSQESSLEGSPVPSVPAETSPSSFLPQNGDLLGNVLNAFRRLFNL